MIRILKETETNQDLWIGFTRFTILDEKLPDGYASRPDYLLPETWKDMSEAAPRKEKQKWAFGKPKLDNARRLRGIFFIDPEDEEFKEIVKNARRMLL